MLLPRSIVFGFECDINFLKDLSDIKNSSPYYFLFEDKDKIFLSGPKNKELASLVEDSGSYYVFLPHPDSDPFRRKITRAVIKSLTNNIPRTLQLKFYNLSTKEIVSYIWDGREENFFPMLPKVSLIVRTGGSFLLKDALNSIVNQTYDHIEVILVAFGEFQNIGNTFFRDLDIKIVNGIKNRGANLNLGVKQAGGDYIAFLDEDDLIMPGHFETLVTSLESQKRFSIAYTDTVLSKWNIKGEKAVFDRTVKIFSQDFDPLELFFENFIPLNSLCIKKEIFLFEKFPENIDAYEDWVFLVRLALKGIKFLHIPEKTAEYRIFEKDLYKAHEKKGIIEFSDRAVELFLKDFDLIGYRALKKYHLVRRERIKYLEKQVEFLTKELQKQQKNEDLSAQKTTFQEISPSSFSRECAILISTKDTSEELFDKLIDSIRSQMEYPVKLYVLDDGSVSSMVETKIKNLQKELGNKKVYFEKAEGLGISRAYNLIADRTKEDFLLFCDHDDELAPDAVKELIGAINPNASLIYADSDVIDINGKTLLVHNKPNWSPDTLLSFNYINHPMLVSKKLWQQLGGFRKEFDGSQDLDFLLRATDFLQDDQVIHILKVLYHWRASPGSVAFHPNEKPWAIDAGKKAVLKAIEKRLGKNKKLFKEIYLEPNPYGPGFLKKFTLNAECNFPGIRIIIPTRGNIFRINELLKALSNDPYPNLYITIVSNGKNNICIQDISCGDRFKEIEILNNVGPRHGVSLHFNWSFVNNFAVKNKKENFFLFLNDDMLPDENFVSSLFFTYLMTKAGIVGGVLFFPSLDIQHNGIRTDIDSIAHEIRDFGAKGELATTRNVSGVTGAAIFTPRDLFFKVKGFEEKLPVNYNDVDYCLKIREQGHKIVIANEAKSIHFHMTTRKNPKVTKKEIDFMRKKWGDFLKEKYFYRWEQKTYTQIKMNL